MGGLSVGDLAGVLRAGANHTNLPDLVVSHGQAEVQYLPREGGMYLRFARAQECHTPSQVASVSCLDLTRRVIYRLQRLSSFIHSHQ